MASSSSLVLLLLHATTVFFVFCNALPSQPHGNMYSAHLQYRRALHIYHPHVKRDFDAGVELHDPRLLADDGSDSTGLQPRGFTSAWLFPVGINLTSWSTNTLAPPPTVHKALNDSTFNPQSEIKALSHSYVNAPDAAQTPSMRAIYPKGSYTYTHSPQGGFSFYSPGPKGFDFATAKEATFGYSVFFEEGFDWVMGGKLPGLYGGDNAEVALSCSGGSRRTNCFSARLMWRAAGEGEFYTYLPAGGKGDTSMCDLATSDCNETYGASIGRGTFHFKAGGWTTVSQRVRLNDIGQANGELQLWANGISVVNLKGLTLREDSAGRIRGMQFQTFFGGHSADYASTKTQHTYFTDFSVAITEML